MSFYPFRQHLRNVPPKRVNRADWASGLRLDRAEVPFPPSPKVVEALHAWAGSANRYPDPECRNLRCALAAYVGCQTSQLLVGNGSDEIIDTIVRCSLDPGDEILVPIPSFYFYQRATAIAGGSLILVPLDEHLQLDVDLVLSRITARCKVVFIANPNNPTGILTPPEVLLDLVERCPCLVVIDECYFEFAGTSVWDAINRFENLLILRSFSKAFGLAGVRLGYAIGNEEIIGILHSAMQPFPVNGAAQVAGHAALQDLAYMKAQIGLVKSELTRISTELEALGFKAYQSRTNFVLIDTSSAAMLATDVAAALRQREIYIWDCTGSPGAGQHYIRITAGDPGQNDAFLREVRLLLAAKHK